MRFASAMWAATGPSLRTMNTFSGDVEPTGWLPKARLGGVVGSRLAGTTLITGRLEPLSGIVRGEPVVPSVIVSVAAEDALARGVYVTSIAQLLPGAMPGAGAVVQFSVTAKSVGFAPPSVTPVTAEATVPVLL